MKHAIGLHSTSQEDVTSTSSSQNSTNQTKMLPPLKPEDGFGMDVREAEETYQSLDLCGRVSQVDRAAERTIIDRKSIRTRRSFQRTFTFNSTIISLLLLSNFISNQSIRTMMSASLGSALTSHLGLPETSSLRNGLVGADPAPQPSGKSRVPPMNGSMFGKRSVDGLVTRSRDQEHWNRYQASVQSDRGGESSKQHADRPIESFEANDFSPQPTVSKAAYTTTQPASSRHIDYKDIITNIIEDFLALNNESDPEQASVAFCRMIVYECNQMLSSRVKARRQATRGARLIQVRNR